MKLTLLSALALATALSSAPALAKTRIVVLPPNAPAHAPDLLKHIAESAVTLTHGDQLLIYATRPVSRIAAITRPSDPTMNSARIKAALAAQFKPVKDYLTSPLPSGGDPPGNLMIPTLIDELARNVFSSLPEKNADLALIGSWLHVDRRDQRAAMTERYVPSDGTLRAPRGEWAFSTVGAQARLAGITLHWCSLTGSAEFESSEHEERVRRFWSLWAVAQSGRIGTFSHDLATCFRRFNAGEASGQTVYQSSRETKAEMLRVPARMPATLPASFDHPGQYFLRDDMPISRTPPATTKGIAWIGIKWSAACDLDLYARGEAASPWLYFGSHRSAEGYFNKDHVTGTGEMQYEFVEFTREIELGIAEVAVNLYSCEASTQPEGTMRVWFAGKVYEQPFKLAARSGNRGAMPIVPPHWLKVDLRRAVGLAKE